jgi:hypothetical protein
MADFYVPLATQLLSQPFLNDIADVSSKFVQAGKLANTSGTAGHNVAYTLLGAVALRASRMAP